ncbi:MAG: hypothetical protein EBU90_06870 [Proteobacteria bacterium]|nr:hypothetical protein [Pseudomonadota bacterium]NBP14030.1 hypothetical protein [bacterium]
MPRLGSGLTLGTISKLPGYDFDASTFILNNNIPDTFTINLNGTYNYFVTTLGSSNYWVGVDSSVVTQNATQNPFGTNPVLGGISTPVMLQSVATTNGRILRSVFGSPTNFTDGFSPYALLPSTSYIMSVYAKAGTHNIVGLRFATDMVSSGGNYVFFNLSTQTATAITPTAGAVNSCGVISAGNDWYRCWVKYTTKSTSLGSNTADFALCNSSGSVTDTTLNGKNAYFWGPMLEKTTASLPSALSIKTGLADSGDDISFATENGEIKTETINPRKLLSDFCVGVKSIGIWNNFICWPMRSFLNLGTGITINSIGGTSLFPATLYNNPVRTPYGIRTYNTNKYIGNIAVGTGVINLANSSKSLFSVNAPINKNNYNYLYMQAGQASGPGLRYGPSATTPNLTYYANSPTGSSFIQVSSEPIEYGFNSISFIQSTSSATITTSINNSSFASTSTSTPTPLTFSGSTSAGVDFGNGNSYVGDTYRTFEAITKSAITTSQASSLYSLFKTTLGYGLNIP